MELKNAGKISNITLNELTLSSPISKNNNMFSPSKSKLITTKQKMTGKAQISMTKSTSNLMSHKPQISKNFDFSNDIEVNIDSEINSVLSKDKDLIHIDNKNFRIGVANLSNFSKFIQGESSHREFLSEKTHNILNSDDMDVNDLEVNQYDLNDISNKFHKLNQPLEDIKNRMRNLLNTYFSLLQTPNQVN